MATQKGRNWSSGDIVTAANLSSIERGVSEVAEEYTPTTWANGNTVTAAGLNNIEQGIVNAGSGSSDFSIAEVTIVNNINGHVNLEMPVCFDGEPEATAMSMFSPEPNSTTTVNVIMYKGAATLSGAQFFEVEGDFLYSGDIDDGLITGNGTITIIEDE